MKRILRPPVISARALLAGLIGMIALFLYGCLGGGGGGVGPSPEDRSLLIDRVDQIVKALATGDGAALDQFRISALGADTPDGSRFKPLYVRDLGDSVTDPNDGNIYTFFYDPNEIVYIAADLAAVPLWTWFQDGNKLGLTLRLFREEGCWYLDSLMFTSLDLTQAAATAGPVPSSALWPMAKDNRWQFVEIQTPPVVSRRGSPSSRVNAMILNATRVDFRTLSITADPLPAPDGRQMFQFRMSTHEAGLATSQLDLPIDPGTFEFGRFSNGVSAVDRGFITLPAGAIAGVPLWELLDPNHQGLIRAFEQSGLFLLGGDTAFNGGRPWRLTDLLVQEGAAATQPITLTAPGIAPRTGEARILVMESLRVSLPWIQGLARRLDISLTWNGSPEVTWTSLFFLPGMGLVGYADYDLATRKPVRFSWVWGASVGTHQFLPPGDSGSLDPFVTIAIAPLPPLQWTVGTPFAHQTAVSGGEPPFIWSLSGAPAWAAIDAGSGLLSGTPMQAGSYSFELSVRDAGDRTTSMRVLADVATAAAPVVSGIIPAEGFQGGSPIPVEITGQNFFGTPLVRLATATTVGPVATGLTLADAGRLSCSLPVMGIATGLWSIEVINPDGQTATGMNVFRVRPAPASVPVTIDQAVAQADPAAAGPIHFTVVFARVVSGFTATDVSLGGTASPAACTVSPLPPNDGTRYDVAVSGMTGNGTVVASLPENIVIDIEGNENLPSTSTDNQVMFDATAPAVTVTRAAGQTATTTANTANFTVTFSENVTGFTAAGVQITPPAGASPVATVSAVSSTTYTVNLSGMTDDGPYAVTVAANAATDQAGTGNTAAPSPAIVTRDTLAPAATLTLAPGQPDPASLTPILFRLTFTKPVVGFSGANVQVNDIATFTLGTTDPAGLVYEIAIDMPGTGGIASVAIDPAGITDTVGNPLSGVTVIDDQVVLDSSMVYVSIGQSASQPDPASSTPVLFTVTFNEPVFGFTPTDVSLGGTANPTTCSLTQLDALTWTIAVSALSADGSVVASIPGGVLSDAVGNGNVPSSLNTIDNEVTVDTSLPSVVVARAIDQVATTSGNVASFSVTFAEPVTGFAAADVIAVYPATLPGVSVVPVSPTTYSVLLTMPDDGVYTVTVPAGAAVDAAGNGNTGPSSASVARDATAPGVAIALAPGQAALMNLDTASFTVTFTEGVTGFGNAPSDITVSGPVVPGISVTEISSSTYWVVLTGMTTDGVYSVQIPAAVASDAAGNANTGPSGIVSVTRNTVAPTAVISSDYFQPNPTNTTPVNFDLVFSKPIQGDWTTNLSNAGTAGPVTWVFATSDPDLRIFTIGATDITGQGTILPALAPTGLTDQAGNPLTVTVTAASVTYDSQPPTVVKIGDGIADVILPVTGISLAFSEPVSAAGRSAIEAEITQIVTGGMISMPMVWSADFRALTLNEGGTTNIGVLYDVVATVSDDLGNTATKLLLIDAPADTTPPGISTVLGNGIDPYSVSDSLQYFLFSEPLSPESVTAIRNALESEWGSPLNFGYEDGRKNFWFSASIPGTFTRDITVTVTDIVGNAATLTIVDTGADATPPSVISLNGPVDLTAPATADLVFSEPLASDSRLSVTTALTSAKSGSSQLAFTWLGGTLRFGPLTGTASWTTDVSVPLLTDLSGNSAADLPLIIADTTPPTVSPLGGTGPYTVNQTVVDLVFSEPVNAASQIAVRDAIAAVVGSPNMISSWDASRTVFSFQANTPVNIIFPIYADVTDLSGNTANLLLINAGPA